MCVFTIKQIQLHIYTVLKPYLNSIHYPRSVYFPPFPPHPHATVSPSTMCPLMASLVRGAAAWSSAQRSRASSNSNCSTKYSDTNDAACNMCVQQPRVCVRVCVRACVCERDVRMYVIQCMSSVHLLYAYI